MKKLTWRALRFIFLFALIVSCQQEITENSDPSKDSDHTLTTGSDTPNARNGSITICLFDFVPGRRFIYPFGCRSSGICYTRRIHCFTIPGVYIPPFPCRPICPDPWDFSPLINPADFIIPKEFGEVEIDRFNNFAIYPVNSKSVVLQFYAPIAGILDEKTIELKSSFLLDEGLIKEFGLEGSVIAPGKKFPVVFNPNNNTYNAIVSAEKFPLTYTSPVAKITAPNFKSSLNDLFSKYVLENQPGATLQETEPQKFLVEPFYSKGKKGIYLFSPDNESLGIVFYGDPSPQPNLSIKGSITLSQEIAKAVGITAFEFKEENIHQAIDPNTGALTVLITH